MGNRNCSVIDSTDIEDFPQSSVRKSESTVIEEAGFESTDV